MNYFRGNYFGAKYNSGFTLPPDEVLEPEAIREGGGYDYIPYKQTVVDGKIERDRLLVQEDDMLTFINIFLQCLS